MANQFLKTSQIVSAGLGVLERELVLHNLVSSDASQLATGRTPLNDTISIRIDGRTKANSRQIRERGAAGEPHASPDGIIKTSDLTEHKIDVKIDQHIYNSVQITDEELSLDIGDFTNYVVVPQTRSVAEDIENRIAAAIRGATYGDMEVTGTGEDFHKAVVGARKLLNDANVPQNGRVLVVGTAVEAAILTSDQFRRYDASGDSNALRAATIGSVGGMNVVVSNSIAEGEAFAFHRSAFQSVFRVPANPLGGVETGSGSYAGIAMRWVKDYDPNYMANRSTFDTYFGINVVEDPVDYTDNSAGTELRRAVKLTLDLDAGVEDPEDP